MYTNLLVTDFFRNKAKAKNKERNLHRKLSYTFKGNVEYK